MKFGRLEMSDEFTYENRPSRVFCYSTSQKIRSVVYFLILVIALIAGFYILRLNYEHENNNHVVGSEFLKSDDSPVLNHCLAGLSERFDCFPRGLATEKACKSQGCCWTKESDTQRPNCFYPKPYHSYKYLNITERTDGVVAFMQLTIPSPYQNDIKLLRMEVKYISDEQLNIKILDATQERYEPIYPMEPDFTSKKIMNRLYKFIIVKEDVGFQVVRSSTNKIVFDNKNVGGFIFSDQFLQLSAILPSKYMYGLGHQRNKFLLDMDWNTITLFNHDLPPSDEKYIKTNKTNYYSTHPFYLLMEEPGFSHGVFLRNSNAMDIVLQPTPAITYRTIGGILDLHFFFGPSPSDVVKQYTSWVGRPYMPPYWSLGFHLSRLGYKTLNETRDILDHNRLMGIPVDIQWNDLDYMNKNNDFTYNKETFNGIKDFVDYLHHEGLHYVILVDPGISAGEPQGTYPPYDEGIAKNIFVMDHTGSKPFMCKVWNYNSTVFPDFTNPETKTYWENQLKQQHSTQFSFDGIWLDMNEPTNFRNGSFDGCPDNSFENPPYLPNVDGGLLSFHTACMSSKHYAGLHYNVHNIYGISQTAVTTSALENITQKRAFVITRATYPGIGAYAGSWTGDVSSTWEDMRYSVADILSFNIFGIPLVGADICGFNRNTTVALCQRWTQLGAFYPFSRNHNSDDNIAQDPSSLGSEVILSAKKALGIRYKLLPYLYTLFWQASSSGMTVARPVFFEFPDDEHTYSQYEQFFWGSGLLIAPVLFENETEVKVYLPSGVWYDYYTNQTIKSKGTYHNLSAPLDTIPLLYRGGNIIPVQEVNTTITTSRLKNMGLVVVPDESGNATGVLYWDDGDTLRTYENKKYNNIEFNLRLNELTSKVIFWNYDAHPPLSTISVLGVGDKINTVEVDGASFQSFDYNENTKVLTVNNLSIKLQNKFVVKWTDTK